MFREDNVAGAVEVYWDAARWRDSGALAVAEKCRVWVRSRVEELPVDSMIFLRIAAEDDLSELTL